MMKKEYVKPQMSVVEYEHENDLLCASCDNRMRVLFDYTEPAPEENDDE